MKKLNFPFRFTVLAGSMVLIAGMATAAGDISSEPPAANSAAAVHKLPYGVEEVLKLTRAQISEDIVVNYVQNSGTVYNLTSGDIVYLRNEGVSDRVINAILDQRKKVAEASSAQTATAVQAPAAPVPAPEVPPATAAPAPVYVQAPAQPAPSTVYVIPYPAASTAYYGAYPPYPYYGYGYYGYGGYYGPYCGPSISLGFRFGGGYWGGHWGGHWHH